MKRSSKQQVELVLSLAKRDIKARYKDSVLGFLWSLVRPAILTVVLWLVFTKILPMPFNEIGAPFWLHVLVSILTWNFFLGSLTDATQSITSNASLLKKVRINSEVFPIAAIISNGVHFALAMIVVVIYLLIWGSGLNATLIWFAAGMAVMILLTLGLSLILSATNVYSRDIGSILELGGMAMFYITPVIYPVTIAFQRMQEGWGERLAKIYMLNPMAPIIVAIRRGILYTGDQVELPGRVLFNYLEIAGIVSIVTCVVGWIYFRWLSPDFADQL